MEVLNDICIQMMAFTWPWRVHVICTSEFSPYQLFLALTVSRYPDDMDMALRHVGVLLKRSVSPFYFQQYPVLNDLLHLCLGWLGFLGGGSARGAPWPT